MTSSGEAGTTAERGEKLWHEPRPVSRFIPFLALALACALVGLAGPPALGWFAYTRHGVMAGEVWRLLTAHIVHAGPAHLAWNFAGLALVTLAVGRELTARAWTIAALAGALGTSLGVLLLSPRTVAMAGLSAMLQAIWAAGGVAALWRDRRAGMVLLFALGAKLIAERLDLWPAAAELGRATAIDAHLYGALAGGLAGLLLTRRRTAT